MNTHTSISSLASTAGTSTKHLRRLTTLAVGLVLGVTLLSVQGQAQQRLPDSHGSVALLPTTPEDHMALRHHQMDLAWWDRWSLIGLSG